jgi:hypothetical protein
MLGFYYAECHYAECRYTDCRYADCRNAQLPATFSMQRQNILGTIILKSSISAVSCFGNWPRL